MSGQIDFDGVSQQGQFWSAVCPCPCMAFMQTLIASPVAAVAVAATPLMVARICMAADAEVIGASVKAMAIKIAKMARSRFSGSVLQR